MRSNERERVSPQTFWLWVTLFVIQMQPLEILFSGYDPSFPSTAYSARVYSVYFRLIIALYTAWLMAKDLKKVRFFLSLAWPFVLFIFYASLTSAYVGSPIEANRYILMTVFPVAITPIAAAILFRPIDYMRIWATALAMLCVISLATVIFIPSIGIIVKTEIGGIGSPGNWRGAFASKNILGHVSSITLSIILICNTNLIKNIYYLVLLILISAFCLIFSSSSTGYIIAISLPAFYISFIKPKGAYRIIAIMSSMAFVAAMLFYRDDIVRFFLAAVGKSADLTGRAAIWEMAASMIPDSGLLGKGINYTTTPEFMQRLKSLFGVGYIHNEFLDSIINLGIVGSLIFYFSFAHAIFKSWSVNLSGSLKVARYGFTIMLLGWLISGITETTNYNMLAFCFVPLFGLLAVRNRYDAAMAHA